MDGFALHVTGTKIGVSLHCDLFIGMTLMKILGWIVGMSGMIFLAGCATDSTVTYVEPVYIGPPSVIWYGPVYPYHYHYYRPPVYHRPPERIMPPPPQRVHPPVGQPPSLRVTPPSNPPRQTVPPISRPTPRGPQRGK